MKVKYPKYSYEHKAPQSIKSTATWWFIFIIFITSGLALYCVFYNLNDDVVNNINALDEQCSLQLVESIPDGLNYTEGSPKFLSTYNAWEMLINHTEESLTIGSFYWTMLGVDVVNHSSAMLGEKIYEAIKAKGLKDNIIIRIAQNEPTAMSNNSDTEILQQIGAAEVRSVNFTRLLGGGVLHTKLWIVDNKHFYIGSANMDWRSLTQVKELGILGINCKVLAGDFMKIFNEYWYLGNQTVKIPKKWPKEYSTKFNFGNPIILSNNSTNLHAVISSSPPQLSSEGRVNDLDSILKTINEAKHFVYVAVMDYYPLIMYDGNMRYWPLIDDALRKAAIENKVIIKLLISWWRYSRKSEDYFLKSLTDLTKSLKGVDIQVRRFIVPINKDQLKIPYSRVNHNKYMLTDNAAYIGTSNWCGDYFTDTAGIGLHLQSTQNYSSASGIREQLLSIFNRDWYSPYAVLI